MAALWKRLEARARGFVLRNRGFSSASIAGNSVLVERENGQMALETVWLRDHCRAGGRYSWETHQRETTLDIEHLNVPAHRVQVMKVRMVSGAFVCRWRVINWWLTGKMGKRVAIPLTG